MSDPFHLRFDIKVPVEEAQRRFINRIGNSIFQVVDRIDRVLSEQRGQFGGGNVLNSLSFEVEESLGEDHQNYILNAGNFHQFWRRIVANNFTRCIQAVEGLDKGLRKSKDFRADLTSQVNSALSFSEVDLGVSWEDGVFIRKGARNLDEDLVNEPLHWLSDPKYQNVLSPFKKGLTHFLTGDKNPERRGDTVTDMYEALEALAGILTGRPSNDLASNRELFISKLGLPDPYKKMLKEYIDYGCQFRHAVKKAEPRSWPSLRETESFVYLTGIFIRIAIHPASPSNP